MAVSIRLQRRGTTHRPFYHIVAADSRAPRDGRFIEKLGYYDPKAEPSSLKLNLSVFNTGMKRVHNLQQQQNVF